jgi:hypothetical protein
MFKNKYLKYKEKYLHLKKLLGGSFQTSIVYNGAVEDKYSLIDANMSEVRDPESMIYPLISLDKGYINEVRDIFHRPSSALDNFSKLEKVYKSINSVPFKNDNFNDFMKEYDYNKYVKYYNKSELNKRLCNFNRDGTISCAYITETIIPKIKNSVNYFELIKSEIPPFFESDSKDFSTLKKVLYSDEQFKASNHDIILKIITENIGVLFYKFIFVMDPYGNFYITDKTENTNKQNELTTKGKFDSILEIIKPFCEHNNVDPLLLFGKKIGSLESTYQTNHTSLSRGSKVSAAGWITVRINMRNEEIRLTNISNVSGHYKCSDFHMFNAFHSIKNKIDLEAFVSLGFSRKGEDGKFVELTVGDWYSQNERLYTENIKRLTNLEQIKYLLCQNLYNKQIPGDYVMSGSAIYNPTQTKLNVDIDSVFIFPNKDLLHNFIKKHWTNIYEVFMLETLHQNKFTQAQLQQFIDLDVAIIRLSGTILGQKCTIKLFSYDRFDFNNKEQMCNIYINKKDVRLYKHKNIYNNQLSDVLLFNKIVEDDVYIIVDKPFIEDNNIITMGLITDLLITAEKQYSLGDNWERFHELLVKNVIEKLIFERNKCNFDLSSEVKGVSNTPSNLFVRSTKINDLAAQLDASADDSKESGNKEPNVVRKWMQGFNRKFDNIYDKYKNIYCNGKIENSVYNFQLLLDTTLWSINIQPVERSFLSVNVSIPVVNKNIYDINKLYPPASTNPITYLKSKVSTDASLICKPNDLSDSRPNGSSALYEITAYYILRQFYKKILSPVKTDDDLYLCTEYKEDYTQLKTFIDSRLTSQDKIEINGGKYEYKTTPFDTRAIIAAEKEADGIFKRFFKLELMRHEEMLSAFIKSTNNFDSHNHDLVHLLFYGRLISKVSEESTGAAVPADGAAAGAAAGATAGATEDYWKYRYDYDIIFNYPIVINNVKYNKINKDKLLETLNPFSLNQYIKVYGFGDGHSGNVLVKNDLTDYITIDYEFSSNVHPCLHMAKCIFVDLFDIYCKETPVEDLTIKLRNVDGQGKPSLDKHNKPMIPYYEVSGIIIQLNKLLNMLLKIKIIGVLYNYFNVHKMHRDNWDTILRTALFYCCAIQKYKNKIKFTRQPNGDIKFISNEDYNRYILSYMLLNDIQEITDDQPVTPFYLNELIAEANYKLTN